MFEAIQVMQALWTGQPVDHHGEYYQLGWSPGRPTTRAARRSADLVRRVLGHHPARRGDVWRPADQRHQPVTGLCGGAPGALCTSWPVRPAATGAHSHRRTLMAHLSHDRERARASLEGYIARGNFGAWLGDFFGETHAPMAPGERLRMPFASCAPISTWASAISSSISTARHRPRNRRIAGRRGVASPGASLTEPSLKDVTDERRRHRRDAQRH